MMRFMKAALILFLFIPSVGYGGKSAVKRVDSSEMSDEFKASPTLSASKDIQDTKKDSEENSIKKRVTWARLSDSEKQPAKRQELSAEEIFFADKERTFETNIAFVQEEIAKAHEKIEPWRIQRAHKKIYSLDYPENVWEEYAHVHNACRWPTQKSWRDVVAGYLFFPKKPLNGK